MAAGDISIFDKAKHNLGLEIFDLANDTFNLMLFTAGATDPVDTATDPRYDATGNPDYSDGTYEVADTGIYVDGGESIGTVTWTESSGTVTFDTGDASTQWAVNGSNPTDARHAVLYDDTPATKNCLLWIDLGSTFDMSGGDLTITWNASGIFQLA